jgi:drug/metabolite transporter (DMT)-like permease
MVGLRFLFAILLSLPFDWKELRKFDKKVIMPGLFLGALLFIEFATQTYGLQTTTASKSGFITGFFVVLTPIAQWVLERRPPERGNIIGIICATVGLYLLTSPSGSSFTLGDALTLLSAFTLAIYMVYLDIFTKRYNTKQLSFVLFSSNCLFAFLALLLFEKPVFEVNTGLILTMIYLGVFATFIAMRAQTFFQKDSTPVRAAVIFSIEPVLAAIIAWQLLDERMTIVSVFGGAIIVAGVLISELSGFLLRKNAERFEESV